MFAVNTKSAFFFIKEAGGHLEDQAGRIDGQKKTPVDDRGSN